LRAEARFTIQPRAWRGGPREVQGYAAAEAAATKFSFRAGGAFCGGRLRGHKSCRRAQPRAERGAGL